MANNQGKKTDQKMKPYLVYEYLMRHSDENNVAKPKTLSTISDLRVGHVHSTVSGILPCEEKKVNGKKKSERI